VKKLAIFVEGKTEQIFVAKLLREIAGKFQISIEIKSRQGINLFLVWENLSDILINWPC
jgi:hypothetical protein